MRLLPEDPQVGWTPYAWLIYLGFLFVDPLLGKASPGMWAATIGAVLVFLPLYFLGYWIRGRRLLWLVAAVLLLGMALVPFNTGASCFFIYAAGMIGFSGPPAFGLRVLAVLLAVLGVEAWLLDLSPWAWGVAALFSLLIGGVNIHFAEVARAGERLRASQKEVERLAQIAERERIARDLHDLLGHTLSVITLKSELAAKLVARDPARAEEEMREVERISREALREVRSAISGYRSEGLSAELARARLAMESAGVRLDLVVDPVELDPAQETVLALALREAVTNVARHARAKSCRISLEAADETVRLEVKDDGRGARGPEGTGLSAMRERVEGIGGKMERKIDGGTVLAVTLPRRPFQERTREAPSIGLAPEGAR